MHVVRLSAIPQAMGLATMLFASTSFASDWLPASVGELLAEREGSVGVVVGGIFDDGGRKHTGTLSAYCVDGATVVNIQSKDLHLGKAPVPVTYQLDSGAPQAAQWEACANGACVGLWSGRGIPLLKALFEKHQLNVVVQRQFGGPVRATFVVDGAKAGLTPVGERCGWIETTGE